MAILAVRANSATACGQQNCAVTFGGVRWSWAIALQLLGEFDSSRCLRLRGFAGFCFGVALRGRLQLGSQSFFKLASKALAFWSG